jgi:hypothetical protein
MKRFFLRGLAALALALASIPFVSAQSLTDYAE